MNTDLQDRHTGRILPCSRACRVDGRNDPTVWKDSGHTLHACECGITYVSPAPALEETDPRLDLHPSSFYALPAAYKADFFLDGCTGGNLLEIGCGEGAFLSMAEARGMKVTGIEADAQRADKARRRVRGAIHSGLFESAPILEGQFDCVYHCDLLSHLPDPVGSLQRMSRMLRPGGRLLLEAGVLGGVSTLWYRLIRSIGAPHHRWHYTEKALLNVLALAGLEVRRMARFSLAPAYVVMGGGSGGIARRLALALSWLEPLSRTASSGEDSPTHGNLLPSEQILEAHEAFAAFLRYRVGRRFPAVGPLTLFIEAVPRERRG